MPTVPGEITADETVRSALSWSGGKDSALTLWTLRRQDVEPEALITTVTDSYDRISMHGVRRELLARQADAAGIPLVEVRIWQRRAGVASSRCGDTTPASWHGSSSPPASKRGSSALTRAR